MRALAGRERILAGTLTTTYVPGELQVADVGTKALAGPKLLGLLELVNVRVPVAGGRGTAVAKMLSHWGSLSVATAERVSPTVALVVAMLAGPQKAHGMAVTARVVGAGTVLQCLSPVVGQPEVEVSIAVEWFKWVVSVLLLVALSIGVWWMRFQDSHVLSEALQQDSTALSEAPQQDSHVLSEAPQQDSHVLSEAPQQDSDAFLEVPQQGVQLSVELPQSPRGSQIYGDSQQAPSSVLVDASADRLPFRGHVAQNDGTHNRSAAFSGVFLGLPLPDTGEYCEFPMVGRIVLRSKWVPSHFLRWLLSVVGGIIVQLIGVDAVEVWRLRGVAKTFRYRVAFAYERARGQLLRTPWGVPVDTSGPGRPLDGPPRGSSSIEEPQLDDDPTIDQVRHVHPDEIPGEGLVDVQVFGPDSSSESSISSEGSSTTIASGSEEVSELVSEVVGPSGTVGTQGSEQSVSLTLGVPQGVGYRAVDGAIIVVCADDELRIPLPGWTFEEVWSIVHSIQCGDWTYFHQVIEWGTSQVNWQRGPRTRGNSSVSPGEIAVGSVEEDSEEADGMPALESLSTAESVGADDSGD